MALRSQEDLTPLKHCPICLSAESSVFCRLNTPYLDRLEQYQIKVCRQCGHGFTIGRQDPSYLSSIYSDGFHHSSQQDTADPRSPVHLNAKHRAAWLASLAPRGRLLDVGAGKGAFVEAASGHFEANGIELSAEASSDAQAHGLDIEQGDFLALSSVESQFDVITLWDVLAGFVDLQAAMKKSHELLKPNGLLIASIPMVDSAAAKTLGRFWPLMIPPVNLHYFSRASIARLAVAQGFQLEVMRFAGKKVALSFVLAKGLRSMGLFGLAATLGRSAPTWPVPVNTRDIAYAVMRRVA